MKKIILAFMVILPMTMKAQNVSDAVRYSLNEFYGTARYRAMGGAFGALGGDLSSLDVNPAGSAVFLNSTASLSLDIESTDNEVVFRNTMLANSNPDTGLGQGGLVMVFNNRNQSSDWRKFSFGINYSKTADFEDSYIAKGVNNGSIVEYFRMFAQGIPLELLEPLQGETLSELYQYLGEVEGFAAQQALLGYHAYLIDPENPDDPQNTRYTSAVAPGSFNQEYSYLTTGINGKFSFNFATQFRDFLYLGVNLNSHFINYDRFVEFYESNDNPGSNINQIYFEDKIRTLGSGFSFQVGAIARISQNIRTGLAYESPTWFEISEETVQYLESESDASGTAIVDPGVINVYPEYKLQTPARYTGSIAYIFGRRALISVDYTYKDYGNIQFKPEDDPYFSDQNDQIGSALRSTSTFRIGGEYRINDWSLRGGYRYQESPYADEIVLGNLEAFSFGLGYDLGGIKVDAAYETMNRVENQAVYTTGLQDPANISREYDNVVLTLTFGI